MTVSSPDPLVGILGGMGPAATADFYSKLIAATPASSDQDHLRVVIWADPTVPDRSSALLDGGPDPTPALEQGMRALLAAGAALVAVPCNTAHAFLAEVERRTDARVVHMMAETAEHIAGLVPRVDAVGLLATTGTVRSGLYRQWLGQVGVRLVEPTPHDQREVMTAISAIKGGATGAEARARLVRVGDRLAAAGAQAVIAGCTEVPLVLDDGDLDVPVIDPAVVLARAVVRTVRG